MIAVGGNALSRNFGRVSGAINIHASPEAISVIAVVETKLYSLSC